MYSAGLAASRATPETWRSCRPFQDGIPEAADYRRAFTDGTGGPHFQRIRKVADLRPGDLIAVDYNDSDPDNTGHIAMVRQVRGVCTGTGVRSGETQYGVEVVDMTSAPHGVYGQPSVTTHRTPAWSARSTGRTSPAWTSAT